MREVIRRHVISTYSEQVAECNRESYGQRRRSVEVCSFDVTRGKDGQNEDHRHHELHAEALLPRQARANARQTEVTLDIGRGQTLEDSGSSHRPSALCSDVEQGTGYADLATGKHRSRYGGVDVSAAQVCYAPDHGSNGQSKCQRNLDHRRSKGLPFLAPNACPAAD